MEKEGVGPSHLRLSQMLSRTMAIVPSTIAVEAAARSSSKNMGISAKQVYMNKARYVAGQNTRNAQYGGSVGAQDSGIGLAQSSSYYNSSVSMRSSGVRATNASAGNLHGRTDWANKYNKYRSQVGQTGVSSSKAALHGRTNWAAKYLK